MKQFIDIIESFGDYDKYTMSIKKLSSVDLLDFIKFFSEYKGYSLEFVSESVKKALNY